MIIQGRFVDFDGVRSGQLRIEDGLIVEFGERLGPTDFGFDDDCLIFAGMGDVHIHAREDVTGTEIHKEDFTSAAAAAIHGGVVQVADMPNNPAAPVDDATYDAKRALVDSKNLAVHYTLYAGIGPGTRPLDRDVPYKAYMGPSVGHLFFRSLDELAEAIAHYPGKCVSFHCEDPVCMDRHSHLPTHETRRPPACELSATAFALELIETHRLVGKLCHVSASEGLPQIRKAKMKRLPVTVEVTPHHVYFDTESITDANRPWMQMNPPLRSPADRVRMLDALRDGTADYLATDHAPHTIAEKQVGVSGQPHLDTYGPFATWLMAEHGFSPERIATICSANPGEFVGPFSTRKFGRLQPGYVGSLTVLNLRRPIRISRESLKTKCGWSPFEGMTFPGQVEAVFVEGRQITSRVPS